MPTQRRATRPIERVLMPGRGAGAVVMVCAPRSFPYVDAGKLHVGYDQKRADEGNHHGHGRQRSRYDHRRHLDFETAPAGHSG